VKIFKNGFLGKNNIYYHEDGDIDYHSIYYDLNNNFGED
jgi:hypothetical protein